MRLYEELKWRGLIKDVAGEDLEKLLNGKPITFYWGTDPTADSLHLGHYSSLVTAKRLAKAGHHPILLEERLALLGILVLQQSEKLFLRNNLIKTWKE